MIKAKEKHDLRVNYSLKQVAGVTLLLFHSKRLE